MTQRRWIRNDMREMEDDQRERLVSMTYHQTSVADSSAAAPAEPEPDIYSIHCYHYYRDYRYSRWLGGANIAHGPDRGG